MRRIELFVALDVEIGLNVAERKDIPDLRPNAHDTRFETADQGARSAVA